MAREGWGMIWRGRGGVRGEMARGGGDEMAQRGGMRWRARGGDDITPTTIALCPR